MAKKPSKPEGTEKMTQNELPEMSAGSERTLMPLGIDQDPENADWIKKENQVSELPDTERSLVPLSERNSEVGLPGFDTIPELDEVRAPTIRLAQGLTPEVLDGSAQPGQWILPSGETAAIIQVMVVGMQKNRALWERDSQTPKVICQAVGGVEGVGDPGGMCNVCPLSQWLDEKPPKCTLSYQYLVMHEGELAIITMSTRSANALIGQLNMRIRTSGYGWTIHLKSTLVTKGRNKYYTPVIHAEKA